MISCFAKANISFQMMLRYVAIIDHAAIFLYLFLEMLRLQHFYNKSQVVSCYWFKFETNIKITFLSQ